MLAMTHECGQLGVFNVTFFLLGVKHFELRVKDLERNQHSKIVNNNCMKNWTKRI